MTKERFDFVSTAKISVGVRFYSEALPSSSNSIHILFERSAAQFLAVFLNTSCCSFCTVAAQGWRGADQLLLPKSAAVTRDGGVTTD